MTPPPLAFALQKGRVGGEISTEVHNAGRTDGTRRALEEREKEKGSCAVVLARLCVSRFPRLQYKPIHTPRRRWQWVPRTAQHHITPFPLFLRFFNVRACLATLERARASTTRHAVTKWGALDEREREDGSGQESRGSFIHPEPCPAGSAVRCGGIPPGAYVFLPPSGPTHPPLCRSCLVDNCAAFCPSLLTIREIRHFKNHQRHQPAQIPSAIPHATRCLCLCAFLPWCSCMGVRPGEKRVGRPRTHLSYAHPSQ